MSCDRFRAAILESALDEALLAAAGEHLALCSQCRQALERERELLQRIDADLRAALEIAPSPSLLPRIHARVAREPARGSPWTMRWLLPAVAGALALFALARYTRQPPPGPTQGERAAPVVAASAAPSSPQAEPRTREVRVSGPRRTVALAPRAEPEVIVPAAEEAALRQLAAVLRRKEVELASVALAEAESPPIEDLKVAPLDIPPLSPDSPR